MQYTNEKTKTAFKSSTTKEGAHFLAVVTRREGDTETLIHREKHATRAKAYRAAMREACYAFCCHTYTHGA